MRTDHYAPANTLLGLLQRGRGQGALIAAEGPASAAHLIYGCIRWEWRWDSQVDDRHLYLARLIRDLELPLGPVIDMLAVDEDTRDRATGVLELLALGGSEEARGALPGYVPDPEEDGLSRRRMKRGDPCPERDSASLLDLLRDPEASEGAKVTALRALSLRPPEPALIPLVPELGATEGTRPLPQLGRAVERLAEQAVPAAREWAASGREWLAWAGFAVLAAHGDESDVPTLMAALEQQWVDQAWCGPDTIARGLARFGPRGADAVSLLRRFWLWTPHSYERPAYLEALAAIGSAGMAEAYTESLWDCESDARLLGIEHAPERPEVSARLVCLRDDPMEEPAVREAAAVRLARGEAG